MLPLSDSNPTHRTPVLTWVLIACNIAVFLLVQPQGSTTTTDAVSRLRFTYERAAIPCEVTTGRPLSVAEVELTVGLGIDDACLDDAELAGVGPRARREVFPDKRVWLAMVVSMFLHADLMHLGGNMLFLWIFGNNIEDHLGHVRYLAFYLLGGVVATLAHVAVGPDSTVPLVGASGAVAAVMGAYLVWFPEARIRTLVFMGLVWFTEIRAKWLLAFWFASQFFIGSGSGVAWMAHVGGFVFGVAVGLLVRASRAARRRVWTPEWEDPWHGSAAGPAPPSFGARRYDDPWGR